MQVVVCLLLSGSSAAATPSDILAELKAWLALPVQDRPPLDDQEFSSAPLSKSDAARATDLLWDDHCLQIQAQRKPEWDQKVLKLDELEMKFDYRVFGEKPEDGRSLFISLHGGGGAPARVNEQQWRNQIKLYEPAEGIYLSPRAPTNTWNLWHQAHIDKLFGRLIENAIVLADVDPNKVYVMGYSAGGDGVYQLAPRMADYWAAAAMMAGHPNDALPLGLRNIGFTLHMGGEDSAYNRNKVAAQWKQQLAELQKDDPEGYQHEVVIHEGLGHWMQRKDQVAVAWMAKFTRDPLPKKIVWRQSPVTHRRFYWLAVDAENAKAGSEVVVSRDGQLFTVEKADKISSLVIRVDDRTIDFDKPVVVKDQARQVFSGKAQRTILSLHKSLADRGDRDLMFSGEIVVDLSAD